MIGAMFCLWVGWGKGGEGRESLTFVYVYTCLAPQRKTGESRDEDTSKIMQLVDCLGSRTCLGAEVKAWGGRQPGGLYSDFDTTAPIIFISCPRLPQNIWLHNKIQLVYNFPTSYSWKRDSIPKRHWCSWLGSICSSCEIWPWTSFQQLERHDYNFLHFRFCSLGTIGIYYFLSKPESGKDNDQFSRQLYICSIPFSLMYLYFMVFCKEKCHFWLLCYLRAL